MTTSALILLIVCVGFVSAHYPSQQHQHHHHQQKVDDPWIKTICSQTDYPTVCETSILPYMNGSNDPIFVLEMQLRAAIQETQTAAHKAATPQPHLAASNNGSDIHCYQSCLKIYTTALDSMHKALALVQGSHPHEIHTYLGPVINDVKACDKCFVDAKCSTNPFHHYDDNIFKMNTNCVNMRLMANPEG